ncbi:MAG: LysM peptidoglycan-binding domain-containing protein [Gammaproteobacteria bacterium]|nr:LysM peptidoglycan-binding domain-containing protein [Gammaproteobacteria bacterium]
MEKPDDSPYIGGYLVVSGDNLWNIAGQDSVYGNPYQWPLIYKANSDQINDADLIYPGQYFNIPKAMGADSDAAIEHAKTRGAWTLGETEASDLQYLNQ